MRTTTAELERLRKARERRKPAVVTGADILKAQADLAKDVDLLNRRYEYCDRVWGDLYRFNDRNITEAKLELAKLEERVRKLERTPPRRWWQFWR